jgi:acyl-CoA synthetase (AMP-forming)/AMP-acid ligase II
VQLRPGVDVDLDDVRAFVDARVAGYKRPRAYEVRAELPRTDAGKLLKRVLRDEFWRDRTTRV